LDKSKAAPQGRIDKLIQESMEIRAIISKSGDYNKKRDTDKQNDEQN